MTVHPPASHRLVILHGITATSQSLANTIEIMHRTLGADEVITPDLPFHGSGEQLRSFAVPDMVDWFDQLMTGILATPGRVTVVAHSYSAAIMLYWIASRTKHYPQLTCIAVAPPMRITRTAKATAQVVDWLPKRLSWYALAAPRMKPIIQAYISTYPRSSEYRARIYESTQFDDNNYERYLTQLEMNRELHAYVRANPITQIHQRTLLILFGHDLVVDSYALAREIVTQGEGLLDFRFIPDAGHLFLSQDPGQLVDVINDWVSRQPVVHS